MSQALTLTSFGSGYKALVIGASGAIGQAFCQLLRAEANCAGVRELSRSSTPASPPLPVKEEARPAGTVVAAAPSSSTPRSLGWPTSSRWRRRCAAMPDPA